MLSGTVVFAYMTKKVKFVIACTVQCYSMSPKRSRHAAARASTLVKRSLVQWDWAVGNGIHRQNGRSSADGKLGAFIVD